jgi:hypothetical protein
MLLSKRCPFTGIVNFYTDTDPHMSVGSIARCGTTAPKASSFAWRCYTADSSSSGHAPDLGTAERRLMNFLAMVDADGPDSSATADAF